MDSRTAGGLLRLVDSSSEGTHYTFFDGRMQRECRIRGLQGWRNHQATGHVTRDPTLREGGPFHEVLLRPEEPESETVHSPGQSLLQDSVLTLAGLVTPGECAHLRAAADRWCDADEWSSVGLRRIECHPDGVNLDGGSHALAHVILSRALWSLECLRPELCAQLFPDAADLGDFWFMFSGQEPMLNRYTSGGNFDPHQDGHALTLLVPLSTAEVDFGGGGTAFWSQETIGPDPAEAKGFPPSLVLRPPLGTGIFWRGHLTHSGLPVTSGTRHVFVASFNLRMPGMKS